MPRHTMPSLAHEFDNDGDLSLLRLPRPLSPPKPSYESAAANADDAHLLSVRDLNISFRSNGTETHAVRGISYTLAPGRALAIVGESGSGKSVSALALGGLLPPEPACRVNGEAWFDGENLLALPESRLRALRGRHIAYVFQEPGTSLNPAFTIGAQLAETIRIHFPQERDVRGNATRALEAVGIRDAATRLHAYPHELSGGMQQRVMLALAFVCRPRLLIADEPTTALDVTIQKQILELIDTLRARTRMALLLITHNFGIVAQHADDVLVMRHGEIVERGPVPQVLSTPTHPYTRALLAAIPRLHTRPE